MKRSDLRNNPQSPTRRPFQEEHASTLISFDIPVIGWEVEAACDFQIHSVRAAVKACNDPALLQQTQDFIQAT